MKTVRFDDATDQGALSGEIAEVLQNGGLACLPCAGRYRIVADLTNPEAVGLLMQAKGRSRSAPALVFVDGEVALSQIASDLDPMALRIARELWPRPLTIRVQPHDDLPRAVLKELGGKKSRIGVRVPADPLAKAVVHRVGKPLLVSSANRDKKTGDSSPAQVRKTFGGRLDIFVDRGDLSPEPLSTVIDVVGGEVKVERSGAIAASVLEQASRA